MTHVESPKYTGYPLYILNENYEHHLCSYCKLILRDPYQIEECGHRYCYCCLENMLGSICPACSEENSPCKDTPITKEKTFPDKAKAKEMAKLKVWCEFKEKGCDKQMNFGELQSHLANECLYALIQCEECSKYVEKQNLKSHKLTECEEREIKCDACHQTLKFKDKKNHDETACPGKLTQCEHCGSLFKDEASLNVHKKKDCPSSWILERGCPFGCTIHFKSQEELNKHREDSSKHHLDMLNANMNLIMTEVNSKFKKDKRSGDSSATRNDETSDDDLRTFLESYHEQIIPEIANEVQQLIDDKIAMDIEFQSLSQEMQTLITTSYDGVLLWPIEKISERIKDAREGKVLEIYSPPFHTGRYGYKLCLLLLPNGVKGGDSWGKSLSIYLVVMEGYFDALLPFPFNESFEISIISDKRQEIKKINFQNPMSSARSDISRAFGSANFIELTEVSSVENLFIKCVVDFKIVTP